MGEFRSGREREREKKNNNDISANTHNIIM